jgi:putative endonuclease
MFYFYVLKSSKDEKYYYGSTQDLKRRLREHNDKTVESTKNRLPLILVYYEAYLSIQSARLREKQVKASGSIRKVLNKRISQDDSGPARPSCGQPGQ